MLSIASFLISFFFVQVVGVTVIPIMVQKYQSPVRVYKHPFELVMAVSGSTYQFSVCINFECMRCRVWMLVSGRHKDHSRVLRLVSLKPDHAVSDQTKLLNWFSSWAKITTSTMLLQHKSFCLVVFHFHWKRLSFLLQVMLRLHTCEYTTRFCPYVRQKSCRDLVVVVRLQHEIFSAMHGFSQLTTSLHVFHTALAKGALVEKIKHGFAFLLSTFFLVSSFRAFCLYNFCIIYISGLKREFLLLLVLTLPQPAVDRALVSLVQWRTWFYSLNIRWCVLSLGLGLELIISFMQIIKFLLSFLEF